MICNIKKQMLQQTLPNQIIIDYKPICATSDESLDVRIIDGVWQGGFVHTQLFYDILPNLYREWVRYQIDIQVSSQICGFLSSHYTVWGDGIINWLL